MTEKERMWNEFMRTGDSSYYMMFKSLERLEQAEREEKR